MVLNADGSLVQVAFPSGTVWIDPADLESLPGGPEELLTSGVFGEAEPYGLRLQAFYLRHAYRYDTLTGLSSARIEPELHQVFVAHQVTQKLHPRMILADEVGLGKTIEAGLIIKELRARQLIDRVLIVVPASLQLQWQSEMRLKFNEHFEVLDSAALKFLGHGRANPWAARDNVICSLPFASKPKRAEQIIEAEWDLVIFDEAHRVRRWRQSARKVKTTQAYRLADDLKELTSGLLMLTATPMQLHPFELYSLIELVEPGLFVDFDSYDATRLQLPRLNALMKVLKGWNTLDESERRLAIGENGPLLAELGVEVIRGAEALEPEAVRETLMDELVHKHPLAGVLVRNRKAEVGGFTSRNAHKVPVPLEPDELTLYRDVTAYLKDGYNRARSERNTALGFVMVTYQKMLASSSHAVRQSFRRRIEKLRKELTKRGETKRTAVAQDRLEELRDAEEATAAAEELEATPIEPKDLRWEIGVLEGLVARLGSVRDSKATELLVALDVIFGEHSDEKAVVFTQFIETQQFLAAALEQNGYAVSMFNGRMSMDEKEAAVRRFRDRDQILISTEAGGEGRNFQFCHIMVNYDLPWNPMRVEQRIGRLDRIGQKRPVLIYNLYCEETVEEHVLDVLENRIGLFTESVGSLDPILGEVERDIERLVLSEMTASDGGFERLEADVERRVRQAREQERILADFVLDRASLRRDKAVELLNLSSMARWEDLERVAAACLEYFGGAQKDHTDGGKVISLSPRLMNRLRQHQGTVRGTFNPALAREREELPFFAFGNELLDRIIDLPLSSNPATTAARRADDVPSGLWVEVYYELRGEGVHPRGRMIRHLVGSDLSVQSQEVRGVPRRGTSIEGFASPPWCDAAVAASRRTFEVEYEQFRQSVRAQDEGTKQEAIQRAERIFRYRRERLRVMIDEQQEWIAETEASGTEGRRRVLPARRGLLAKNKERLAGLEEEFEVEVEGIQSRQPGSAAEVVAAGVVMGT